MAPSIWDRISSINDWVHDSVEEAKEWAQSVYEEAFKGAKGTTTPSSSKTPGQTDMTTTIIYPEGPGLSSTAAGNNDWQTLHPMSSTESAYPASWTTSSSISSSSYVAETKTVSVPATVTETATATATITPPAPSHASNSVGHFAFVSLEVIVAAALAALFIYYVIPFLARFALFVWQCLKIWLGKPSTDSFMEDSERGLSSDTFSLTGNIDSGDSRNGLEKSAKIRILWYMFFYNEPFDKARLRYVRRKFAANGIGPDGQPLDPKFVGHTASP